MRVAASFLFSTLALLASGCSDDDGATLLVDMRTDLRPGHEFVRVRTEVAPSDGEGAVGRREQSVTETDADALLAGRRVAEFANLAAGEHRVVVQLLRADDSISATQRLRARVTGRTGVTVVVTRSCAGVTCPPVGGAPVTGACLSGTCVDERCSPESPESCPAAECASDTECGDVFAACASATCVQGRCLARADDSTCASGEWCQPETGCTAGAPTDAATDASVDAPSDAAGDGCAGPCCGVTCSDLEACVDGACERDTIVQIDSGAAHTCARTQSGRLWCWGYNGNGQLGDGTISPGRGAALVPGLADIVAVTAGDAHTCAIRADRRISCWGRGEHGRLGTGDETTLPMAGTNVMGITDATAVSAGYSHVCALRADRTVWCWGDGNGGALGQGAYDTSFVPIMSTFPANAAHVVAGSGYTCVIDTADAAWCWGQNGNGARGTGDRSRSNAPQAVTGGLVYDDLDTIWGTTCGVSDGGRIFCNGHNEQGQAFPLTAGTDVLVPTEVTGTLEAVEVAAGRLHACLRTSTGAVRCWGGNTWGELGLGTVDAVAHAPANVPGLTDVVALTAGEHFNCALSSGGNVSCWGKGDRNAVGSGLLRENPSPVPVPGLP